MKLRLKAKDIYQDLEMNRLSDMVYNEIWDLYGYCGQITRIMFAPNHVYSNHSHSVVPSCLNLLNIYIKDCIFSKLILDDLRDSL